MLRTLMLAGVLACAASAAAQPPQEMPKPGAEQKELARFVGAWKMEGTAQPSPFGPGGKFTGTETCRMFEGWHLLCDSSATTPMGPMKGHMVMSYDRGAKRYQYFAVSNMPDAELATGTRTANGWTFTSSMDMEGKKFHSRFTIVEKTPTVHQVKWEVSEDGKSWMAVMEGTSTKTGS